MQPLYDRYLRLLGFDSAPPPDLPALRSLVRAHILRVPFENLSKLVGLPRTLAGFLDAIEQRDLGGTCYTNNPHFAGLLRTLGFQADLLGADMSSPNVHTAIRVLCEGRQWHIDTGYGAPYYEPVPLDSLPHEIRWGDERHLFDRSDDDGVRLSEYLASGARVFGYIAHQPPRDLEFFRETIDNSYRPGATFLTRLRLVRFFGDYSMELFNARCTWKRGAEAKRWDITGPGELRRLVQDEFQMPRAPIDEALDALERNTGTPLFTTGIR